MAALDYQAWYVGQTYPSWDFPVTAGGAAENLAGVDVTKWTLYFKNNSGLETAGTGTFSLKASSPGEVLYKPTQTDVTALNASFVNGAFSGNIIIKALYPPSFTNADEVVFDPIPFTISAS